MQLRTSHIKHFLSTHPKSHTIKTIEVCAINELPIHCPLSARPALFVINTDPNFKQGAHWVLVHLPKNTKAHAPHFFDPLGHPPSFYGPRFPRFLRNNTENNMMYTFNGSKVQSDSSTACGFFCCFYAISVMLDKDLCIDIVQFMKERPERELIRFVLLQCNDITT